MRGAEAAARQQDDARFLGQAEQGFVRFEFFQQPLRKLHAMHLRGQRLHVQQVVVAHGIGVVHHRQAQFAVQRFLAAQHDALHRLLVLLLFIHQREQREQGHLRLHGRGQAGRVVQRHRAAVGHQAVDEFQLARLRGDRVIARIELLLDGFRQLGNLVVEHIVFMRGHHAHAPAGRAEVFRERVHEDGVERANGEQRDEIVDKGAIHVIL